MAVVFRACGLRERVNWSGSLEVCFGQGANPYLGLWCV
jgi:hypothetical protein